MKTKEIQIYTYDKLNEKAKERALDNFRNNNDYPFLSEDLRIILTEKLTENKISFDESLKLYYSLSYCQGDGFCFIGDFEFKNISVSITHKSHYYHEKSVILNFMDSEGNNIENDITAEFEQIYLSICKDLARIGYSIIKDENSEESIKDFFNCNEIMFRENGVIEN